MSHMLALLPLLACAAMMFGTSALLWLTRKTPLRRLPWIERRVEPAGPDAPGTSRE